MMHPAALPVSKENRVGTACVALAPAEYYRPPGQTIVEGDNNKSCKCTALGAPRQRHIWYSHLRVCKEPPQLWPGREGLLRQGTPEPWMVTSYLPLSNPASPSSLKAPAPGVP